MTNLSGSLRPSHFFLTRRIFLSALGIIYLIAFLSLAVQVKGLIGIDGILPAELWLRQISLKLGPERYWYFPTLFWLNSSDFCLLGLCYLGAGFSLILIIGLAPAPLLFFLWLFYLSLFTVGNIFLGYQWDILLLEVGFLSIFFAPLHWSFKSAKNSPPSMVILWLLRWLLFRLMFQSGAVKWLSGDPAWRHLTALEFHYETQPLPTWIGYYAHQLPAWFQKFSCFSMFAIELAVPFLIFTTRRLRMKAGVILIAFQCLIMATGNYNFFNLLTIVLCFLLFDDRAWFHFLKRPAPEEVKDPMSHQRNWPKWVMVSVSAMILFLSLGPLSQRRIFPNFDWPLPIKKIAEWVAPLHIVNGYGLFSVMTRPRYEIRIEGSYDGQNWLPYEFRYKPDNVMKRPSFVEPHQPRLDWQMWFSALTSYRPNSWFHLFLTKLLEGSPEVLALLKSNPFPEKPPRFIRSFIAEYAFTDLITKRETGRWWDKGIVDRIYSPILSLEK